MFKCELLLKTVRSKIDDMHFFGFVNLYSKEGRLFSVGHDNNEPFFLRSLLKPFQASVGYDFNTPHYYNFTEEENAITTASHTGEGYHVKLVDNILKKAGLNESFLKCGVHPPLGNHNMQNPVNNNCSGKHALMLAISKQMGWDLNSYLDFNHPLQKKILNKIETLFETKNLIPSKDGCNAPIWAAPFDNIARGFFNLFEDNNYNYLKNAMINNPLVLGGDNRLDTKIIQAGNKKLVAKVGAGGFLGIYNLDKHQFLLIKMAQDNNIAREILAQKILLKLGWIKNQLKDDTIHTNDDTKVAEYKLEFNF